MLRAVAAFFSLIILAAMIYIVLPVHGHGVSTCPTSRIVRLDNEQFSSNKIITGESIIITGELRSIVNRDLDVKFVPLIDKDRVVAISGIQQCGPGQISVSDADEMAALEWQFVNASYSADPKVRINMEPGAEVPFSLEIKSTDSGTFRLATAYIVADTIVYIARGQSIHVQPTQVQLQKCADLGISNQECSNKSILHFGYWTMFQLIGIGAAVAGVIAFIMLRKKWV